MLIKTTENFINYYNSRSKCQRRVMIFDNFSDSSLKWFYHPFRLKRNTKFMLGNRFVTFSTIDLIFATFPLIRSGLNFFNCVYRENKGTFYCHFARHYYIASDSNLIPGAWLQTTIFTNGERFRKLFLANFSSSVNTNCRWLKYFNTCRNFNDISFKK